MWNTKASDETILRELRSGLTPEEVGDKHGLSTYWVKSPRAHRLIAQARKEQREQEAKAAHPVTTYRLPLDEVERRYGRPGTLAEKKEYTWVPGAPERKGQGK